MRFTKVVRVACLYLAHFSCVDYRLVRRSEDIPMHFVFFIAQRKEILPIYAFSTNVEDFSLWLNFGVMAHCKYSDQFLRGSTLSYGAK